MTTHSDSKQSAVLALVFFLVSIPIGTYIQTWAIYKLWNWHAVSTLGAPQIGMWPALGLACLLSAFTLNLVNLRTEEGEKWTASAGRIVGKWLGYGLLVWIGYIAT